MAFSCDWLCKMMDAEISRLRMVAISLSKLGICDVGELVQNQPHMDRQPTAVFIIRTVTQQVDKLALEHSENEVEGGVCVAHNQKQHGLFIPDGVQFHFIVLHQFPHLPDVKWG